VSVIVNRPIGPIVHNPQQTAQARSRALELLTGLADNPHIRNKMKLVGWSPAEHARGRAMLMRVLEESAEAPTITGERRRANLELHAWLTTAYARTEATLTYRFPDMASEVLGAAGVGPENEAVPNAHAFLDRLDALAESKAGRAVLSVLETRGVTKEDRAHARKLLQEALAEEPDVEDTTPQRRAVEAELYAWVMEWSALARSVLTRRVDLQRLGLVRRRPRKADVLPAPVPAPAPHVDAVPPSRAA
jgi:hypothetical protein